MLHVLPQANIPFRTLPIDQFVSSYHSTKRKEERGEMKKSLLPFIKEVRTARTDMEEAAVAQNMFMVKEFQFDHVFYELTADNFTNEPHS